MEKGLQECDAEFTYTLNYNHHNRTVQIWKIVLRMNLSDWFVWSYSLHFYLNDPIVN